MSKRGSNSELFAHGNDALTAIPQLHKNYEGMEVGTIKK